MNSTFSYTVVVNILPHCIKLRFLASFKETYDLPPLQGYAVAYIPIYELYFTQLNCFEQGGNSREVLT